MKRYLHAWRVFEYLPQREDLTNPHTPRFGLEASCAANAQTLRQVLPYDASIQGNPVVPVRWESAKMTQRPKLDLMHVSDPFAPPTNLGRLWYDDEICAQFFGSRVTVRWVREHLPRDKGLKIGRGWAWYESDILEWINSRRGAAKVSA
jgi:hypothetical protein